MKARNFLFPIIREAGQPLAVLFIGTIVPLHLVAFLWTNQIFGIFDVMHVANEHHQFYHMQMLLVPLCIMSIFEAFIVLSNTGKVTQSGGFAVAVVAFPLVLLCIGTFTMLMHAVTNYSKNGQLDEPVFATGVTLIVICFGLMVVGEICNAVVKAWMAAQNSVPSGKKVPTPSRSRKPPTDPATGSGAGGAK